MTPTGPFRSRRSAAWTLAAGPAASLVLAVVMLAGAVALRVTSLWPVVEWVLLLGAATNLMVGLVNLVPARPLDGGRILEVVLMAMLRDDARAATVSSWVGASFGVGVIAAGCAAVVTGRGIEPGVVVIGAGLVVLNVGAQLVGAPRCASSVNPPSTSRQAAAAELGVRIVSPDEFADMVGR